jgi:hypothetical protein
VTDVAGCGDRNSGEPGAGGGGGLEALVDEIKSTRSNSWGAGRSR